MTDAEYQASLVARGVPENAADMLTGMFAASRAPNSPRWTRRSRA